MVMAAIVMVIMSMGISAHPITPRTTGNASGATSRATEGRVLFVAGRVAGRLKWGHTTARPAPNRRQKSSLSNDRIWSESALNKRGSVTYRLEPCVRSIEHQPNGFQIRISFGSTVSAAKKAMNIADAINTPK